jgi:DnaK suppressor protein
MQTRSMVLSDQELESVSEILQILREVLERRRTQRGEALEAADPPPMDATDQATREEQVSYLDALGERERDRIQAIDDALARITAGTYGICTSCREAIDPARLRVSPETDVCVQCAQKREPPHRRSLTL